MSLKEYARKRSFAKTPEPKPDPPKAAPAGNFFCVQRHHATRLHYDFRLEVGGALVSWAIPKGPTLKPSEKRLAMHVEDHPLDYGNFEGNIPAGNYGAGSVMLWDRGTYELLGDLPAKAQLERGDFKFRFVDQPNGWVGEKTKPDVPYITNLRLDPFERTGWPNSGTREGAQQYFDWFKYEFWRFVFVQQEVLKLVETAIEFPPMQKGASFNLEAVKEKIAAARAAVAK